MNSWSTRARAELGANSGFVQKLISVPLKKGHNNGKFDLFYFYPDLRDITDDEKKIKTLLFCSGGPGRIVQPGNDVWFWRLREVGYRIVYFHIRGSGFSQIPESNKYDEYLRTELVADDIDEIRKDLFGAESKKGWDAIIGYSYGAALAQVYASLYQDSCKKLILIGPISLEKLKEPSRSTESFAEYQEEVKKIRMSVIDKIFELEKLHDQLLISEDEKAHIKEALFEGEEGVFKKIEMYFGAEQNVIENYEQITKSTNRKGETLLQILKLDYSEGFFRALRQLHLYGTRIDNDGAVNQEAKLGEIGEAIARGLISRLKTSEVSRDGRKDVAFTNAPRSKRVFEVMGIYDGFNRRFIKEWNETKNLRPSIQTASGSMWDKVYGLTSLIEIIGGLKKERISITGWSPADYKHKLPTLILKGTADPVTADGQAETYRGTKAVGEDSILLEFEGVGHEFILPVVDIRSEEMHEKLRSVTADPLNCLIYAFVDKDFYGFINAAHPIRVQLAEKHLSVITHKP